MLVLEEGESFHVAKGDIELIFLVDTLVQSPSHALDCHLVTSPIRFLSPSPTF
jgi:hypothetical protein